VHFESQPEHRVCWQIFLALPQTLFSDIGLVRRLDRHSDFLSVTFELITNLTIWHWGCRAMNTLDTFHFLLLSPMKLHTVKHRVGNGLRPSGEQGSLSGRWNVRHVVSSETPTGIRYKNRHCPSYLNTYSQLNKSEHYGLSVYLCLYRPFVGPGPLFQFLNPIHSL
jgi:hypothetical protein